MTETLVANRDEDGRDQAMIIKGVEAAESWANADRTGELAMVPVAVGTRGLESFTQARRTTVAYNTGRITLHRSMPEYGTIGPENYLG